MRNIQKSIAAVVLILAMAVPASAASKAPRSGSLIQQFRQFVVRVASRVSPPVGNPAPASDEAATKTVTKQP